MKEKFRNNAFNILLSTTLVAFGIYVLLTGEIKNMQLGSERVIPASIMILFGIWWLIISGVRIVKK